jgi:hypothetical protein
MTTAQSLDRAAKALMTTYVRAKPWKGDGSDPIYEGLSIRATPVNYNKYAVDQVAEGCAETAAKVFIGELDNYPLKTAHEALINIALTVRDEAIAIEHVHTRLRTLLDEKLGELSKLAEWEFLTPVSGLYVASRPIQVGRCQFRRVDEDECRLWAQRCTTAKYNPPADALVSRNAVKQLSGLYGNPILLGQTVAVVRVHAADADHAWTAGESVVEETLNLWRFGQLAVTGFGRSFPEIQLAPRQEFSQFMLCAELDDSGFCGVATSSRGLGGSEGVQIEAVKLVAGWQVLEGMLHKPHSARSELERRITTALLWCGNAALSRADSVRLASLVTALEAMLLKKGESKGKKAKLTKRFHGLIAPTIAQKSEEVYSTRSDCIHNGEDVVEEHVMAAARRLVAECIGALTTDVRFAGFTSLDQVLNIIDPSREAEQGDE